ncbi:hypothetical protein QZH44_29960 (plasmid) [Pseudomonas corrugata]|uniref:hypothetical protein n=1 Tax=Pseudomonas corrugata TaxID=47879 RepID=UPI003D81B765
MTDVDEKSRRLADWHERLGDPEQGGSLEDWQERLRHDADAMKAQGLIDREEAYELRELADAAYSHYLEEAIVRELNQ